MDVGEVKGKITADSSGFSASTESAKSDLKEMANEMIKAMRDVAREQTGATQTIERDKAKEQQAVRETANAHRKAADEAQQAARKQAEAAREQENALKRLAVTTGVALAGIMKALKEATNTTVEFRNAMMGLESVAKGTGQDLDATKKAAQSLTSDGLMPLSDAATGLKNLLLTGFSLDEATVLMNRFKDSAAFGRQGTLEFGEAIRTATEGIKNGNSILVDFCPLAA